MLNLHFIQHAFALPAFLSLLILLPTAHPRLPTTFRQLLPCLTLAVPVLVAWNHVFGLPLFPPRSLINWLFYFCMLACTLDIVTNLFRVPAWLRYPLAIIAIAVFIYLLCQPKIDFHWSLPLTILLLAFFTAMTALTYLSFDHLSRHTSTLGSYLIASAFIIATALCLALALGRSPAELLVLPIASLLVTLAFARRLTSSPGPILLFTMLPLPPLLTALLYLDLSPTIASLLVCTPPAASTMHLLTRRWPPARRVIAVILAASAPLLAAIALSILAYTHRAQ